MREEKTEAMHIDWDALAAVCATSLTVVILLVGAFSFGLAALTRPRKEQPSGAGRMGTADVPAKATAVLCFAICAALACYGIVLIVSQSR
ncbi:hypothetical protein [Streptomyces tubercidicus]|uniref:hypothetical protein n=1 Tax=Streptomyces tubercidicus TaxID=47759 RepID=UPI002E17C0DC